MKIYTKSGDDGQTGLFHGPRVSKDDARIEAYGTVDELSAVVGVARATLGIPMEVEQLLLRIQHELFALGAELATPDPKTHGTATLGTGEITWLEEQIDRLEEDLPPLTSFILPAGTPAAAALHHARVVCRRAERRIVSLSRNASLSEYAMIYLNRASDLLFVLARYANQAAGHPDVPWEKEPS